MSNAPDNGTDIDLSQEALDAAAEKAMADFSGIHYGRTCRSTTATSWGWRLYSSRSTIIRLIAQDQRKAAGKAVNMARGKAEKAYSQIHAELEEQERQAQLIRERVDVTVPTTRHQTGALHPITALSERISDIFIGMGWEIADGPEVEAEYFNFDALNFKPDHPARTLQDTFHVGKPGSQQVLRTHTSPVQVRSMLERDVPLYIACPGRVFRTDELDATHTPVFHQIEGLAVDKGLNMAHLRGTLDHLAKRFSAQRPPRVCVQTIFRSLSLPLRSMSGSQTKRAVPAGSNGADVAWSTPTS